MPKPLPFERLPLALVTLALASGCVVDSARRPLIDVEADAASRYVFRGQTFTERPVAEGRAVLQLPTKHGGGVTVGALGVLELSDSIGDAWGAEDAGGEFTQTDLWLGYTRRFGGVEATLGVRHYSWPQGERFRFAPFPSTSEAFARLGRALGPVDAGLTLHYDFDAVGSLYGNFELSHALELGRSVTLETLAWLGWSDAAHGEWLYRRRSAGLADLGAELAVRATLDDVTAARLAVSGSTILDSTYRDWFDGRVDADVVWLTLGVAWAL